MHPSTAPTPASIAQPVAPKPRTIVTPFPKDKIDLHDQMLMMLMDWMGKFADGPHSVKAHVAMDAFVAEFYPATIEKVPVFDPVSGQQVDSDVHGAVEADELVAPVVAIPWVATAPPVAPAPMKPVAPPVAAPVMPPAVPPANPTK